MIDWSDRLDRWVVPSGWHKVVAVDAHTEGEPLRVILSGFPPLRGETLLERRRIAQAEHDGLRRTLMWEPRGHADMYGCIVGPPVSANAQVGVLFMHNEGFSTMCGHGIIGVATVLVECGLIEGTPEETVVGIDTPAGFIQAVVRRREGGVRNVSFVNVASFAAALDQRLQVPGLGTIRYDLAYGGAFYAYVRAPDFDLRLDPSEVPRLIDLGRTIKRAVQANAPPVHPDADDLGFLYGTVFVGPAIDPASHSRNVCVFADGEVDRSPTGTGVSGRLAIHHAKGELAIGEDITVESVVGTTFTGRVVDTTTVGPFDAVVPEVTGRAFITGRNELLIDPADPLAEGFLLG